MWSLVIGYASGDMFSKLCCNLCAISMINESLGHQEFTFPSTTVKIEGKALGSRQSWKWSPNISFKFLTRPHSSCMHCALAMALMCSPKEKSSDIYKVHQPSQIRGCRLLLVCTRLCISTSVPGSVPPNCMYIPITISCVNVVDDVLSAGEESKCILYEPVLAHDHSSNYALLWIIIKDQSDSHTYLKKPTFSMAIAML